MFGEIGAAAINAASSAYVNQQNINAQRTENAITRSREDNAYQRVVRDLRAAGLSPLVADSQGSALSQPLTAPQMTENPVGNAIGSFSQSLMARSQNAMNNAQIAKVLEETRGQSLNNSFIVQDMNARLLKLYEEANNIHVNSSRERVFLEEYKKRLQAELLGANLKNAGQSISNNAKTQEIAFKSENADFFRSMGLPPLANMSTSSGGNLVDAARLETKTYMDSKAKEAANSKAFQAQLEKRYEDYKKSALENYKIYLQDWENTNKRMQKAYNGGRNSPQWQQWYKNNPKPKKSDFLISFEDWKKRNVK